MEVKTVDLRVAEEPVGILSKEKHGSVRGQAIPQQIEIFQHRHWRSRSFKFQPACRLGRFNESRYPGFVYIP